MEQMVRDLVVLPDANAESTGSRRHLARASVVVRQVPVFEMRSLPLARSTQVITCAAVAGVDERATTEVVSNAPENRSVNNLRMYFPSENIAGLAVSSSHYFFLWSSEERTTLRNLSHFQLWKDSIPPPISRILPTGFAPFLVLIWYETIA